MQRQAQALKVLELARAKEAQALSEMMDEAASTDATSEEHMLMLSKSVTRLQTEVASLTASLDKCRSENDHLVSERVALLAHKVRGPSLRVSPAPSRVLRLLCWLKDHML